MSINRIGSYTAGLPTQSTSTRGRSVFQPLAGAARSAAPADEVQISAEGQAAAESAGPNRPAMCQPFPARADGSVHVEDVRAAAKQQLGDFQSRFQELLTELGIDDSAEIRLQTDATGRVRVVGDHPQKEQIEQLFVDHPEMRDQFVHITASLDLVRAADEHMAFSRAYAEDPKAAVEQFSHLFDATRKQPPISLVLSGGKLLVDPPMFPELN